MDDRIKNALDKHLKGVPPARVEGLASKLAKLPADGALALLDTGIGLASASLRAAVEFLRTAPDVSLLLSNDDLRLWGDIGKRFASVSPDLAVSFFQSSLSVLESIPVAVRPRLLAVCERQSMISSAIALACFNSSPQVLQSIGDEPTAGRIYTVAGEIAKRSATQSAEFLSKAPEIIGHLRSSPVARRLSLVTSENPVASDQRPATGDQSSDQRSATGELIDGVLGLASVFAERAGALATEFLFMLPQVMPMTRLDEQLKLLKNTRGFLERGGGVALQYFQVAAKVLDLAGPLSFERWTTLALKISTQDNAAVYNFLKITPRVVTALTRQNGRSADRLVCQVLDVVHEVIEHNVFLGIECFKSSPQALALATVEQFANWAQVGIRLHRGDSRRAQAYYALETRASQQSLLGSSGGLALESVGHTLQLYIEGLTGRRVAIKPMSTVPDEMSINDGKTIHLPAAVSEFGDEAKDFKLYKVLAAHGAGQIEFGTYASDLPELIDLQQELQDEYGSPQPAARSPQEETSDHRPTTNDQVDFSAILSLFPDRELAERVFTTLENGRIDFLLRAAYRGLRRDLDFVQVRVREKRPTIAQLPPELIFPEILFRIAMLGGVDPSVRHSYPQLVQLLESIVANRIKQEGARLADSLDATHLIYRLLTAQALADDQRPSSQSDHATDQNEGDREVGEQQVSVEASAERDPHHRERDDPFTFWARSLSQQLQAESEKLEEYYSNEEMGELQLEPGDRTYYYDEWDHELADFRAAWCRVIERVAKRGGRQFVEQVRTQYAPLISSIRYQFQLMRPEALQKIKGEVDGEDFDLQAVIDYALDRRTSGRISDRLYMRRLRRQRDVAVSFLLDMSSSTARTVSPRIHHPGAPARPGKRIIDIEKEGLVLMSEALEAVGDAYAIQGFTSEGRHNVKFYVVKDFDHKYSPEVEARIGGITYQNNTRLGAAIRRAAERLIQQEARTKLLLVLSDGRPYDHDYGDSRYAREDTKIALRQARMAGITPFCITIDRESEVHLRDLYGEVGYTIIDDVLSLPERLPGIYRRLTQ